MTTLCTCNDPKPDTVIREKVPDGFERIVVFAPAHHCEQTVTGRPGPEQPDNSHGIGSMRLGFVLAGPQGATQALFNTGWFMAASRDHVKEVRRALGSDAFGRGWREEVFPECWDVGYHALEPRYTEQTASGACEYLGGKPCYYDGSSLRGEGLAEEFLAKGPGFLWEFLRNEYDARFPPKEAQEASP